MSQAILRRPAANAAEPSEMPPNRWEFLAAGLVLFLSLGLQLLAVYRADAVGQDFKLHQTNMLIAAEKPFEYAFGAFGRTNPPLFYLVTGGLYRLFGPRGWIYAVGAFNSLQNFCALGCLYVLGVWLIPNPRMRVTMLALVAFLPAFQITSVVFAADAFCQAPFTLGLVFIAAGLLGKMPFKPAFVGFTLCVALSVSLKYTAISLIPGGVLIVALLCRQGRMPRRNTLAAVAAFILSTSVVGGYWVFQNTKNVSMHFSADMGPALVGRNQMNLRSLLFFRSGDRLLLKAPNLWELALADSKKHFALVRANYFSYPGLLAYSTFTDSMKIFQSKPRGEDFGTLTEAKVLVSRISCILGFGWLSATAVLVVISFLQSVRVGWDQRHPYDTAVLCLLLFALAWHAFILTLLPTVKYATVFGYWLPRLILPSLMVYALAAFRTLAVAGRGRTAWEPVVIALVVVQCCLHAVILV
ncbi:MAG TPA: hypothetical protein VGD78_07490 [Chthoniobacterales bacterium]